MEDISTSSRRGLTAEGFNQRGAGHLPGLVGLEILLVTPQAIESRLAVRPELLAPNGYLHAAAVIALADTSCGYGCVVNLPQGARQGHRHVPLHPDGALAERGRRSCQTSPHVIQSGPRSMR